MSARKKLTSLAFSLFAVLVAGACSASTYYVSTSGSNSADGRSTSTPFRTLAHGSSALSAGDKLLLKRGDVWGESKPISVSKPGITIGAYGPASSPRPVIDERKQNLGNWNGAVHVTADNVTVRDLDIRNSGGMAVRFFKVKGGLLDNVRSDWSYLHTFQAFHSDGVTFRNSESIRNNTGWKYHGESYWGNGISVVRSKNILVEKNIVREGWGEGIDSFYGSSNVVIQDNIVYASRAVGIYVDSTRGAIIRRNIVLGTTQSEYHRTGGLVGGGIVLNNESYQFTEHGGKLSRGDVASDIQIYNNLVAGTFAGISIWGQYEHSNYANMRITHNIVVDNKSQLALLNTKTSGGNNLIANNAFISTTGASSNTSGLQSAGGYKFSSNYWSSQPSASARSSTDVVGGTTLKKTSGWRNIGRWNQVTAADFLPSANSSVWNAGQASASGTDGKDFLNNAWSNQRAIGSFANHSGSANGGNSNVPDPEPEVTRSSPPSKAKLAVK